MCSCLFCVLVSVDTVSVACVLILFVLFGCARSFVLLFVCRFFLVCVLLSFFWGGVLFAVACCVCLVLFCYSVFACLCYVVHVCAVLLFMCVLCCVGVCVWLVMFFLCV